jgi:hypothetical protein
MSGKAFLKLITVSDSFAERMSQEVCKVLSPRLQSESGRNCSRASKCNADAAYVVDRTATMLCAGPSLWAKEKPLKLQMSGSGPVSPQDLRRGLKMKKTISTYWPITMLVPLALAGYCHAIHPVSGAAAPHLQSAATVSAEFARAISLGLVGSDNASNGYRPANGTSATAVSQTF